MHIITENKRKVFLLGITIIIFALLLVYLLNTSAKESTDTISSTPIVIPTIPSERTFTISGVTVANFYPTSQEVNETSDATLFANENYSISFVGAFQKFIITVSHPDFYTYRSEAEAKLLEILQISETDVCRLDTEVAVPIKVESPLAGGVYYLNFCEPK